MRVEDRKMISVAKEFALKAHGAQMYGSAPYSVHLDAVAEILKDCGEEAIVIGYLHDVVEDTSVSLAEIEAEFGAVVAKCVGYLSDAGGGSRSVRKAAANAKLAAVPAEYNVALVVKAADRLANVRASIAGNAKLLELYAAEHAAFKAAAYRAGVGAEIWEALDTLLEK
jgi:(p)ppGpp synthase/HD superfamily hydrolase